MPQARAEEINEEFDAAKDYLSSKYNAGPWLMYDCADRHWVCTGEDEHKACQALRDTTIEIGRTELPCVTAPLYPTKRECYIQQRKMVARGNIPRSCMLERERKRFIGFR